MNHVRLRHLISVWLDGTIEPDELRALTEALRESGAARAVYLSAMGIHAELCNAAEGQRYLDQLQPPAAAPGHEPPSAARRDRLTAVRRDVRPWLLWAVAAALLFALVTAGGHLRQGATTRQTASDSGGRSSRCPAMLVDIRPVSHDCRWYVEHARRTEAESLQQGDVIRVPAGRLELRYASGVVVALESPAAYQLVSPTKSRMLLGRLTAEVSEVGRGFSVITPRATVIDLGTRFSVTVDDDGATDVVVFKGQVDVDYGSAGGADSQAQRLYMGEAVRLDAQGTASRIVSISNSTYSSRAEGGTERPIVIAEVRDNIERNGSLNYYEIVHEGMREDALAYVDREAHQWNGVDASGMPPYLIGGDYVKTFNNDKFNHDIHVGVRLAVPAKLYILFDQRLPVPNWLRDGFRDTGDVIGMDTGPFFTKGAWHNRTAPGVGPGDSVEDRFGVWVRNVPQPGVVCLGATEAPESEPNMYGVVAVPLDAP